MSRLERITAKFELSRLYIEISPFFEILNLNRNFAEIRSSADIHMHYAGKR